MTNCGKVDHMATTTPRVPSFAIFELIETEEILVEIDGRFMDLADFFGEGGRAEEYSPDETRFLGFADSYTLALMLADMSEAR